MLREWIELRRPLLQIRLPMYPLFHHHHRKSSNGRDDPSTLKKPCSAVLAHASIQTRFSARNPWEVVAVVSDLYASPGTSAHPPAIREPQVPSRRSQRDREIQLPSPARQDCLAQRSLPHPPVVVVADYRKGPRRGYQQVSRWWDCCF